LGIFARVGKNGRERLQPALYIVKGTLEYEQNGERGGVESRLDLFGREGRDRKKKKKKYKGGHSIDHMWFVTRSLRGYHDELSLTGKSTVEHILREVLKAERVGRHQSNRFEGADDNSFDGSSVGKKFSPFFIKSVFK